MGCFWPLKCCGDGKCQVGFPTGADSPPFSQYTKWFSAGEINEDVDASNINSAVFGAAGNAPLNILFVGDIKSAICGPAVIPTFTDEIATFITNGGIVVVVSEVSTCGDNVGLSGFLSDIGSSMSLNDVNVDAGCHVNSTQIQAHALTVGVGSVSYGGSTTVNVGGGSSVVMNSGNGGGTPGTATVIAAESIGDGLVIVIGDANLFTCPSGPDDRQTFFDNFCNFEPAAPMAMASSRAVIDGPKLTKTPSILQKVWNATTASAAFIADGMKTVDGVTYRERLSICDNCEHRDNTKCSLCGCKIALKARGRAFECPDGRWKL